MENSTIEKLHFLEATTAITGVSGSLSILSSFLIIFVFWEQKENHTIRLLKLLSLSNLLYSAAIVMGSIRYVNRSLWNSATYCKSQAFILTWFGIASFFWTTFIAFHATLTVSRNSNVMKGKTIQLICNVIAWILPLIISVIAIANDALGEMRTNFSHTWCWVGDTLSPKDRIMWILLAGRGWEILAYLACVMCIVGFCTIYYVRRKTQIENIQSHESSNLIQSADNPRDEIPNKQNMMIWIGFYLYLPRIWGTIRYVAEIVRLATGNEDSVYQTFDNTFLFFVHCLGDSGQAIINFIIFCLCNEDNRKLMKSKMSRIFLFLRCCYSSTGNNTVHTSTDIDNKSV